MSGAIEDQMEAFGDLGMIMVLSIILVFIVMASQFESLRMPFIIMFPIPFAFSGVFIALFLTGTKLSVIAAIGAVMLLGMVFLVWRYLPEPELKTQHHRETTTEESEETIKAE